MSAHESVDGTIVRKILVYAPTGVGRDVELTAAAARDLADSLNAAADELDQPAMSTRAMRDSLADAARSRARRCGLRLVKRGDTFELRDGGTTVCHGSRDAGRCRAHTGHA